MSANGEDYHGGEGPELAHYGRRQNVHNALASEHSSRRADFSLARSTAIDGGLLSAYARRTSDARRRNEQTKRGTR